MVELHPRPPHVHVHGMRAQLQVPVGMLSSYSAQSARRIRIRI